MPKTLQKWGGGVMDYLSLLWLKEKKVKKMTIGIVGFWFILSKDWPSYDH